MNKVMRMLPLAIAIFFVGCVGVETEGSRSSPQASLRPMDYSHYRSLRGGSTVAITGEYNSNYEDVWNATMETIQATGHPILAIDKENGLLTTDWLERQGGPFFLGLPKDYFKDRFSIIVRKISDSITKVNITRSFQIIEGIKSIPKASDGEIEKWLLEEIALKISD